MSFFFLRHRLSSRGFGSWVGFTLSAQPLLRASLGRHEPLSRLLVSPLIIPIMVTYIIPYITFFLMSLDTKP